jgi:hypothetical protein
MQEKIIFTGKENIQGVHMKSNKLSRKKELRNQRGVNNKRRNFPELKS